jgi:hypothetical protein
MKGGAGSCPPTSAAHGGAPPITSYHVLLALPKRPPPASQGEVVLELRAPTFHILLQGPTQMRLQTPHVSSVTSKTIQNLF